MKQSMTATDRYREQNIIWDGFLGSWERAKLIRNFLWTQKIDDERLLLTQFLARLRRFFGVDFCYGALFVESERAVAVGVPEAGLQQLPQNFPRRCLDLVAASQSPITWKQGQGEFGFRSAVVAPLTSYEGQRLGVLMMGHSGVRSFTSMELFLLQSLADELSWVVRDLGAKRLQEDRLGMICHEFKNPLQLILGNAALLHDGLASSLNGDHEKQFFNIEKNLQQILQLVNDLVPQREKLADSAELMKLTSSDSLELIPAVNDLITSFAPRARKRGIEIETVYAASVPVNVMLDGGRLKRVLTALLDTALNATSNEVIEVHVQNDGCMLEFMVRDSGMGNVAEKLNSNFDAASRKEAIAGRIGQDLAEVRELLEVSGGDIYLRSRPGGSSEFIIRLPYAEVSTS